MILLWLAQFALECSGCYLASRRKLWVLAAYLGWGAFSAALTFYPAYVLHQGNPWPWFICRGISRLLLTAVCCEVLAKMQRADLRRDYVLGLLALQAGLILWGFEAHHWLVADVLSNVSLLVGLVLGWVTAKGVLEWPWSLMAAGLA